MKPKLRVSSSVIGFKEKAERTWGLEEWQGINDPVKEIVFFGMYHERDLGVFEMDFDKRIIFWCGSDILRMTQDYERRRIVKNYPETEHYCENEVEQANLLSCGITAKIVPSFLDDVNKYQPSFVAPTDRKWKIWLCAHPEREDEYGVALAKRWAEKDPELEFHVYGVDKNVRDKELPNVIFHGKVPEAQLNEEIKSYHAGFRPNFHDGMSEVTAKSVLLGQYPITRIKYADIWNYETEEQLRDCWENLKKQTQPNPVRDLYLTRFNNFPWKVS